MTLSRHRTILSAIMVALAPGGAAMAAGASPTGVWIDHSGEGAVEITECGGKLCGRVVWLKKPENANTCNTQVIGDAKPVAGGKWDGGWIYDPDSQNKYDVEITPIKGDRLKVFGYAGTKMFGETMTWIRAPADLKRCDKVEEAKSAPPVPAVAPVVAEAPVQNAPAKVAEPAPAAPGATVQSSAPQVEDKKDERSVAPPVYADSAVKRQNPPQVAAKTRDEFEIEGIKVRMAKGKCGVTIKELVSFDFPCD